MTLTPDLLNALLLGTLPIGASRRLYTSRPELTERNWAAVENWHESSISAAERSGWLTTSQGVLNDPVHDHDCKYIESGRVWCNYTPHGGGAYLQTGETPSSTCILAIWSLQSIRGTESFQRRQNRYIKITSLFSLCQAHTFHLVISASDRLVFQPLAVYYLRQGEELFCDGSHLSMIEAVQDFKASAWRDDIKRRY